ncbi:hypothetical protein ACFL6Y_10250 [Elusimicrobiota bacterium]
MKKTAIYCLLLGTIFVYAEAVSLSAEEFCVYIPECEEVHIPISIFEEREDEIYDIMITPYTEKLMNLVVNNGFLEKVQFVDIERPSNKSKVIYARYDRGSHHLDLNKAYVGTQVIAIHEFGHAIDVYLYGKYIEEYGHAEIETVSLKGELNYPKDDPIIERRVIPPNEVNAKYQMYSYIVGTPVHEMYVEMFLEFARSHKAREIWNKNAMALLEKEAEQKMSSSPPDTKFSDDEIRNIGNEFLKRYAKKNPLPPKYFSKEARHSEMFVRPYASMYPVEYFAVGVDHYLSEKPMESTSSRTVLKDKNPTLYAILDRFFNAGCLPTSAGSIAPE